MEFAVGDGNRKIVDAGVAVVHEASVVKIPIFVAIRPEPVSGVVMPLVGKANGDAASRESPELLDEAVIEFPMPLAREEFDDGAPAGKKFGAVAPDAIHSIGEGDFLWLPSVPTVFREADFFDGRLPSERRERWAGFNGLAHWPRIAIRARKRQGTNAI